MLLTVTNVNPMKRPRRPPTLETYKMIIISIWIKNYHHYYLYLDQKISSSKSDRVNDACFLVDVQNLRLWGVEEHIHHCYIFPGDNDGDDDGDDDHEDHVDDHVDDHDNGNV